MRTQNATITVKLLLFAQFREALGGKERSLEVERGVTPRQLMVRLSEGHERLTALRGVVRYIVNGEFSDGDEPLRDGDEVAFVPPVAGGKECT